MSRIGRMPITVPSGVDVKIADGNFVTVKGPKGTLEKQLHNEMILKQDGSTILVERPSEQKKHKALHGLTRTLPTIWLSAFRKASKKNWKSTVLVTGHRSRAKNW